MHRLLRRCHLVKGVAADHQGVGRPNHAQRIVHHVLGEVAVTKALEPIRRTVGAIDAAALEQSDGLCECHADGYGVGELDELHSRPHDSHTLALEVLHGPHRPGAHQDGGRDGCPAEGYGVDLLVLRQAGRALKEHHLAARSGGRDHVVAGEQRVEQQRIGRHQVRCVGGDPEAGLHQPVLDGGEGGLAVGDLAARNQPPFDRALGLILDLLEDQGKAAAVETLDGRQPRAVEELLLGRGVGRAVGTHSQAKGNRQHGTVKPVAGTMHHRLVPPHACCP